MTNNKDEPRRESSAGMHFYSLYTQCPRKWFLKYILGLIPDKTGPALIFGSAMHKGLEAFYKGTQSLDEMVRAFVDELGSREGEYSDSTKYTEDLSTGPRLLKEWFKTWGEDELTNYEILEVEQEHVVHFGPDDSLIMTVRLDQLVKDKSTGIHYVKDLKTTGWSAGKIYQQTDLGDQMTCYIWAANKVYPEIPIHDAIVDILYHRGQVVTATRPEPLYRTKWDLMAFELGMYGLINELSEKVDLLKEYPPEVLFPRNGNNCGQFGCEYLDICRGRLTAKDEPLGFHRDEWYQQEVAENIKHVDVDKVLKG